MIPTAILNGTSRTVVGQLVGVGLGVSSRVVGNLGTRAGEALGCGCKKY